MSFDDRLNPVRNGETAERASRLSRWSEAVHVALEDDPLYVDRRLVRVGLTLMVFYAGDLPASLEPITRAASADGVAVVGVRVRLDKATLEAALVQLSTALRAAEIDYHSIALGTHDEGTSAGLNVGAASVDDGGLILELAAKVVPDVPVVVTQGRPAHW